MKNRIIIMAVLAMFLWSCDQDSEDQRPALVSVEDAQAAIDDMNLGLQNDIAEMLDSKGGAALSDLTDLMSITDPSFRVINDSGIREIENIIRNYDSILSPLNRNEEEPNDDVFAFEANWGIYNWDSDLNDFVKSDAVIDHIEINFPTDGSLSNNAYFVLLKFSQTELEGEVVPTEIVAQLLVDGNLELALDLKVDYSFLGFVESVSLRSFIAPFEFNFSFDLDTHDISLAASISRDQTEILSASITGIFSENSIQELSELQISFSYGNVILLGTVDVVGLNELSEEADINDYIDFNFYSNQYGVYDESTFIGEVILLPDANYEELVAYIQYSDGSTELLSDALSGMFGQVEPLLSGAENI